MAAVAPMGCTASTAISPEKPLVKTPEQLTADAELAELRRLTPEQEAAAAIPVESVDWGAPGDARHAWKGKFFTA